MDIYEVFVNVSFFYNKIVSENIVDVGLNLPLFHETLIVIETYYKITKKDIKVDLEKYAKQDYDACYGYVEMHPTLRILLSKI